MRRRSQAITEFALVFPVFMVCVFTFIFLSIWSYNSNAAANVAREAARAGSLQSSRASQYFATHPITSVVFPRDICDPYGLDSGSDTPVANWIGNTLTRPSGARYSTTEVAAFRARNTLTGCAAGKEIRQGSPVSPRYLHAERVSGRYPYDRLGWDWGILNENASSAYAIAPLRAAIAQAQALLAKRVIGGSTGALISACYRVTLADGQLSDCVMTLRSGESTPTRSGVLAAGSWLTTAPAPSAISVAISLPTLNIAFLPPYIERGGATLLLDRLTTPCRAPLTASDAFPGACGGLY
jgi:hypothetical protein